MDEFIDLSAFGSSSSRESSPMHLPNTPELNDPSTAAAFAADPFYQSLFAASSISQVASGSGNGAAALDGLKDGTDSWSSFDRLLSPSFLGQSSLVGGSPAGIDDLALFTNHFASTSANGGAPQGGIFGSPPLTTIESSPSSSPSTSFPLEHTESNSSYSTSAVPTFGHPSFAIDPQLVAASSPVTSIPRSSTVGAAASAISSMATTSPSPAAPAATSATTRNQFTKRAPPPPGSYNEDDEEDDDDEDEDGDLKSVSRGSSLAPLAPPKSTGISGKAATRKSASGIVQTGGIMKQRVTSAVVAIDKDPNDIEDWRPTPEEYKKLSSKEKRQLRNKISARNFRVRRKGSWYLSFQTLSLRWKKHVLICSSNLRVHFHARIPYCR
jgi:hypothetical protein